MYISEAWLAGFVEGDGCFSTQRSNYKYFHPKIEIHQKNLEPLEAVRDTFGFRLYPGGRLPRVQTTGRRARETYSAIAPFLSEKRRLQASAREFTYSGGLAKHCLEWFAGYYEAEGCIYNKKNGTTDKIYVGMTISQYYSDETSQFCLNAVGHGRVAGPYMAKGERRAYSYNLSGTKAIETIESIKHMLSAEKVGQLERVKRNAKL